MKDILQRLGGAGNPPAAGAASPLMLAAFGKHPGWDDHIPGIGGETEGLALFKQTLYVTGIGGQIDSGAWEKLEPERRLEGFDHSFLWLGAGRLIMGQMWSSTDGKGRSKYPMVVCVESQGILPAWALTNVGPELERLRDTCKATTSSARVMNECRAAQERLNALTGSPRQEAQQMEVSGDVRRRFVERTELGPDRRGLLRVMHELDNALGVSGTTSFAKLGSSLDLHPCHIRLPLCAGSRDEALLLWTAFLRCVVPERVPVLMIARGGVPWFDLVLGRPGSSDLFCLQASPKALPLATEIPYELAPDLGQRLQAVEARFLEESAPTSAIRTTPNKETVPPPLPGGKSAPASRRKLWIFLLVGALAALGGAVWFLNRPQPLGPSSPPAMPKSNAPPQGGPAKITNEQAALSQFQRSANLVADGKKLLEGGQFDEAIKDFESALRVWPQDAAASNLLAQAREQAGRVRLDAEFAQHMVATRAALESKQLALAAEHLKKAQALKANDPRVLELQARVNQQRLIAADQTSLTALSSGRKSFEAGNYDEALNAGLEALKGRPNDPEVGRFLEQVRLAKEGQVFQRALKGGQEAFATKDFALATSKAEEALRLKPDDSAAAKLKQEAATAMALHKQFTAAMSAGLMALQEGRPNEAIEQAGLALKIRPGDQSASGLLQRARAALPAGVAVAAASTNRAGAMPAHSRPGALFTNTLNMEFVWLDLPGSGAFVGKYEVTQKQFREIMPKPAGSGPGESDDIPVANISYQEAMEFCSRLGRREGKRYGLLAKAEFQSLAGVSPDQVADAWTVLAGRGAFEHEVTGYQSKLSAGLAKGGSRGPQPNGLCDLLGNVREWVEDVDGAVCAGFAYNSNPSGWGKNLFVKPAPGNTGTSTTGFRCVIR